MPLQRESPHFFPNPGGMASALSNPPVSYTESVRMEMSDGREEREERDKRRRQEERENRSDRDDRLDRDTIDPWQPERRDS